LSINGKREKIKYRDLLAIGEENNIKSSKGIIGQVLGVLSNWEDYATEADVGKESIK